MPKCCALELEAFRACRFRETSSPVPPTSIHSPPAMAVMGLKAATRAWCTAAAAVRPGPGPLTESQPDAVTVITD